MIDDKAEIRELKRELIDRQREIGKIAMKYFAREEEIERQKLEIDILIRKKEALRDEIAEKDAEIERLKNAYKQCAWERDVFSEDVNAIKSEAYREFADSLTKKVEYLLDYPDDLARVYGAIDNTLEELTEKNDKG